MSDPKLFSTDGPTENVNVNHPEDVYQKMMKTDGLEMGFEVNRVDPDPNKTFSMEALETVRDNIGLWIGTRVIRRFADTKRGPHKLQVHVTVALDGEVVPVVMDLPFITFSDGQHRTKK